MDLKSVKEFLDSAIHEEIWMFEVVFCFIVPAFLFLLLISKEMFFSIELIKLFLLCIVFNSVLFYILFINEYEYHKELVDKIEDTSNQLYEYDDIIFDSNQLLIEAKHDLESKINSGDSMIQELKDEKEKLSRFSIKLEISRSMQDELESSTKNLKKELMVAMIKNVFLEVIFICIINIIFIILKYIYDIDLGKVVYTSLIILVLIYMIFKDHFKKHKK